MSSTPDPGPRSGDGRRDRRLLPQSYMQHIEEDNRLSLERAGSYDRYAGHAVRCHQEIRTVIGELPENRQVLIVGAGNLTETPVEVFDRGGHVILADIDVASIERALRRLNVPTRTNVEVREVDLTGILSHVANATEEAMMAGSLPEALSFLHGRLQECSS